VSLGLLLCVVQAELETLRRSASKFLTSGPPSRAPNPIPEWIVRDVFDSIHLGTIGLTNGVGVV